MMGAMRSFSLTNLVLAFTLSLAAITCGRKGDPIPRPRAAARAPEVGWQALRKIRMVLPSQDEKGDDLVGIEVIRVLYLPLGLAKPTPQDVFSRGEVILERRRPDLPGPGQALILDLKSLQRPQGWIVLVAVRLGNVAGRPSDVLAWMDPAL